MRPALPAGPGRGPDHGTGRDPGPRRHPGDRPVRQARRGSALRHRRRRITAARRVPFGHVVAIASLAKAFGAPAASVAGPARIIRQIERHGGSAAHSSPPSTVDIAAAARALERTRLTEIDCAAAWPAGSAPCACGAPSAACTWAGACSRCRPPRPWTAKPGSSCWRGCPRSASRPSCVATAGVTCPPPSSSPPRTAPPTWSGPRTCSPLHGGPRKGRGNQPRHPYRFLEGDINMRSTEDAEFDLFLSDLWGRLTGTGQSVAVPSRSGSSYGPAPAPATPSRPAPSPAASAPALGRVPRTWCRCAASRSPGRSHRRSSGFSPRPRRPEFGFPEADSARRSSRSRCGRRTAAPVPTTSTTSRPRSARR